RPGAVFQRLAQRDIKITGEPRIDAGLGHRHLLHRIQALFRMQDGNLSLAIENADGAFVGGEVGSVEMARTLEDEAVAAKLQRLSRSQPQVALVALLADQHHTHRAYRHAKV